ncbi:MAG: YkgJ family cysteine cluster protein [Burkholderiaceae bacterium]
MLRHTDAFSYACKGCGGCCRNKRIAVTPYEVWRLSRACGIDTGEFLARHVEPDAPYLRVDEAGECVFLREGRCSVHRDRPLVCRLYPLGRQRDEDGDETFWRLEPRPGSPGVYGTDTTVADYLAQQQVDELLHVVDRYQALYYHLFDLLRQLAPTDVPPAAHASFAEDQDARPADGAPRAAAPGAAVFHEWFDVDRLVGAFCERTGRPLPTAPRDWLDAHIDAIDAWLDAQGFGRGGLT